MLILNLITAKNHMFYETNNALPQANSFFIAPQELNIIPEYYLAETDNEHYFAYNCNLQVK